MTGGAGDAVRVRRVCDGRGRRRGACEAWQSLGACEARTRRGVVLLVANASKYRILLILDRLSRRLHSREARTPVTQGRSSREWGTQAVQRDAVAESGLEGSVRRVNDPNPPMSVPPPQLRPPE